MVTTLADLAPISAELILAIGAMALLLLGVIRKTTSVQSLGKLAAFLTVIAIIPVITWVGGTQTVFNGMFTQDAFAQFMKALVLLSSVAAILMSGRYLKEKDINSFEFPVLMVTATLGMLMMVSAASFLSLYVGLELQSLSLYVLAAINRNRSRSTEAGLKYFVLGAVSSGLLLYGISLIYGFAGTVDFAVLADVIGKTGGSLGLTVGVVFVLAGLAFKVSAVPFHMWTPDVYEGAPTPVTAFFAAGPKIAAMALLIRVTMTTFPGLTGDWQSILIFLSVASMVLGAFAALPQTNIKRLMAYSSIGHVGYALVGLAAGTQQGVESVMIYMTIYATMTVGTFAAILCMKNDKGYTEQIEDLAGLSTTHPKLAFAIAIYMFSLAGIPLLAGFFGKWFVFMAAINAGLYTLATIGVLASVVAAYYYLRIVKLMYFDDPAPDFAPEVGPSRKWIMVITALANSPLSLILISSLVAAATTAAATLF